MTMFFSQKDMKLPTRQVPQPTLDKVRVKMRHAIEDFTMGEYPKQLGIHWVHEYGVLMNSHLRNVASVINNSTAQKINIAVTTLYTTNNVFTRKDRANITTHNIKYVNESL